MPRKKQRLELPSYPGEETATSAAWWLARDRWGTMRKCRWESQPSRPRKNQHGITGWVEEEGGITGGRMHMCAVENCAGRMHMYAYKGLPPPEHVRFISWAEPVAEAPVAVPLVALPLGDPVSAMAEPETLGAPNGNAGGSGNQPQ